MFGAPNTGSTIWLARNAEITIFLNSPPTIRNDARDTSIRPASRGRRIWGISSSPRTIGPAIRCGKNERYTETSSHRDTWIS